MIEFSLLTITYHFIWRPAMIITMADKDDDLPILEPSDHIIKTICHSCTIDKERWNSRSWSGPVFLGEGLKWKMSVVLGKQFRGQLCLQLLSTEVTEVWITSSIKVDSASPSQASNEIRAVDIVKLGFSYEYNGFQYKSTDKPVTLDVEINILRCDGDPLYKVDVSEHTLGDDMESAILAGCMVGSDVILVVISEQQQETDSEEASESDKDILEDLEEEEESEGKAYKPIQIREEMGTPSKVQYKAHKFILAIRSPVFARMFEQDMQEAVTNEVHISDIDPAVVKEMLTFVYTDQAPNLKEMASSLLYVAEKYQIERLKALCERQLSSTIEVENAADILLLAHMHNAPQLKKIALNLIAMNGKEVMKTEGWKRVEEHLELMREAIQCIFDSPYVSPPGPVTKKSRLLPPAPLIDLSKFAF